ncbi:MAG: hypothetical protein Q3976_07430 [Corynebacterium sp.]|nr:hypothetical protein [Corynebacterium sp.]
MEIDIEHAQHLITEMLRDAHAQPYPHPPAQHPALTQLRAAVMACEQAAAAQREHAIAVAEHTRTRLDDIVDCDTQLGHCLGQL